FPLRERAESERRSRSLLHLGLAVAGVGAEGPRRRELAQLVADHLLGDEHGHVLAAVVDGDRVSDHLREDGGRARPGADHPLLVLLVHGLDAAHQPLLDERPLLARSTQHSPFKFLRAKRSPNSSTMKMRSIFIVFPYLGAVISRSAGWIPCACGVCACRASAHPTALLDGDRPSTSPRRRRAGGRPGSSPTRGRSGACPASAYDPPSRP